MPAATGEFALRWLLATGCRRGELVGGRWDEIAGNAWTVRASRVKTSTDSKPVEHVVPLSCLMRELLADLPRENGYLLPGNSGRHIHATTINAALAGSAGGRPWRISRSTTSAGHAEPVGLRCGSILT